MSEPRPTEMKVDLQRTDGDWHVVLEHDGQRRELGGIGELIRYLESLAPGGQRPVRGLR